MKYEAVVYFASPRTVWAGKVHDEDVIARRQHRWRWLARLDARSTWARLDAERCGYALLKNGDILIHEPAEIEIR